MQTFLPIDEYYRSASVLDFRRLGKQRSETKQILQCLLGQTSHWKNPNAWKNHPAVLMWKGYEASLCRYGIAICEVWIARDYEDFLLPWFKSQYTSIPSGGDPFWLGKTSFHASHRSQLLRKDPEWYGQFGWTEKPGELPYCWPVRVCGV